MSSVSLQKQPELYAQGMKEYGWRLFLHYQAKATRADARIAKRVAVIWRAWGGPGAQAGRAC